MAGLNNGQNRGGPPPYSEQDLTFPRHQQDAHAHAHVTPVFKIPRKPVNVPDSGVIDEQRNRHQRSYQELVHHTPPSHPSNLRHQRSFQDGYATLEPWGDQSSTRNQGDYKPYRPPVQSNNSQSHQTPGTIQQRNHQPREWTRQPAIHHQGSYQDLRSQAVTNHSPILHHSRTFHSPRTFEKPNTPALLGQQRSYQDIGTAERRHPPTMQHLRSFRSGRKVEEPAPEPEKLQMQESGETFPPEKPDLSLHTDMPPRLTEAQIYAEAEGYSTSTPDSALVSSSSIANSHPSSAASSPCSEIAPSEVASSISSKPKSNAVTNAFREARHFAGGLVSHPYETSRHFTILRHSHGLVFYQGTSTSLALSIFADEPLPPNHTFWLQSKGYSGKTGMKLKAFVGANSSWVNVSPSMGVTAEQLNPSDERAWQRDIARFRKKAKPVKIREKHQLRETVILRVPAEAGDGYFSVVLCIGDKKKTLLTSPTFRLMSTSTSMHVLRGASPMTLPLELGAMAASVYATTKVKLVAAPVAAVASSKVTKYMPSAQTVTSVVSNQVKKHTPSILNSEGVKSASTKAFEMAGGKEKVKEMAKEKATAYVEGGNARYEQQREDYFTPANSAEFELEQGPQAPYPIRFNCTNEALADTDPERTALPITNLSNVPDHITHQLHGHYYGWIRVGSKSDGEDWQQALITALPPDPSQLTRIDFASANKRQLKMRLIEGYDADDAPAGSKLSILILGFQRPDEPLQRANIKRGIEAGDEAADEAAAMSELNDVAAAQAVLDHEMWAPECFEKGFSVKGSIADARMGVSRMGDKVPLHLMGVRMAGDKQKEAGAISGFFVTR